MRIVIAMVCACSLVMAACGDDDGETSLETFCEKNVELDQINAELFAPPDETPEEAEALVIEGLAVAVAEDIEAAAPDEIQETMEELPAFDIFAGIMEANDWDVEASGAEMDASIGDVDPEVIARYTALIDENCPIDAAASDG